MKVFRKGVNIKHLYWMLTPRFCAQRVCGSSFFFLDTDTKDLVCYVKGVNFVHNSAMYSIVFCLMESVL